MPPVKSRSVLALEENSSEVYLQSSEILLRVASNILKDPNNPKFRSLSLGSNVVTTKLLPASGAIECLFEMGFQEGDDKLVFPQGSTLDSLKQIHDELLRGREEYLKRKSSPSSSKSEPVSARPADDYISAVVKELLLLENSTNNPFLKTVVALSRDVLKYENRELQLKALNCVPIEKLSVNVHKIIRRLQSEIKTGNKTDMAEEDIDYQELFLGCLAQWFKMDFFKWVDSPDCSKCGKKTTFAGGSRRQDFDRIELYKCPVCQHEETFTRYNDPGKLLETRRGRCGEWANCFALICRSLGWDTRLVVDVTDHVWTEVYSTLQKKWLHCDPCEMAVDKPLLYETGWNKKLSYVVAHSADDVQDVVWRYSCKHADVVQRRKQCTEEELLTVLVNIRKIKFDHVSETRRKFLAKRCALELVELMKEKSPSEEENRERISGSLAWKLSRGEASAAPDFQPFTWKMEGEGLEELTFTLRYSTAKDAYCVGEERNKIVPGLDKGLFQIESVLRKEEPDWKMVYWARADGTAKGTLTWKFEAADDLSIEKIQIKLKTTVFQTGRVLCTLCAGNVCVRIPSDNQIFSTGLFKGSKSVILNVELSGGEGDVAWQHAQILRQELDSSEDTLEVLVSLRPV